MDFQCGVAGKHLETDVTGRVSAGCKQKMVGSLRQKTIDIATLVQTKETGAISRRI